MYNQIIDANINRISEGLRVIEEYVRFVKSNATLTNKLASIRKTLNATFPQTAQQLQARETNTDTRAKEVPEKRTSILSLLTANFKRVQEGLRVLEEYTSNPICNSCRYDMYDLEQTILLLAEKPTISKGIYLISDSVSTLKQGIDWQCSLIQLRDKFADKPTLLDRAYQVKDYLRSQQSTTKFIINDFMDIALLVDADGIHTGQDDISVAKQRRIFGNHKLIGKTTHNLEQGLKAQEQGADYISVGPIWETPSKPNRDGIGFTYLQQAQQKISIPYVAIGGINNNNIQEVMTYTPPMIGVIRAFEYVTTWKKTYY